VETNKVPAPRTPLYLEVGFKKNYAREEARGILKNISLSGAFLEFRGEDFRANEKLHLRFVVGIKFMPTNNRDVQIVDDLIYFVENNREGTRDVLDKIFKKVA
jgi:hypothetical protein